MTNQDATAESTLPPLPYNPRELPRELARHYIPATDEDLKEMLAAIGTVDLKGLFANIDAATHLPDQLDLPEELEYDDLITELTGLAQKNRLSPNFADDGLARCRVAGIVPHVCGVRNLTTSYTPYQPERSQGTLMTHWIYQCALSMLTGYEAVSSSLYERSTALFEAFCCALRLTRGTDTVILSQAIYPGDLEVIRTLAADTKMRVVEIPPDARTGLTDAAAIKAAAGEAGERLAAIAFPQVNTFGLIEDADGLTDLAEDLGCKSIAIIDPVHLAAGGLKPPSRFGRKGADIMVGEGQHLAIGPNFGGPGLGIFGVRHNETTRNHIRATPGRYVGLGRDANNRECLVMVLSTREQHIRREKATSNICSNQAYLATIAGAAMLERGDEGLAESARIGRDRAMEAVRRLSRHAGVNPAFPEAPFFNEVVFSLPITAADCLAAAREFGVNAGVDVSDRLPGQSDNLLKLSFNDCQSVEDLERLYQFFDHAFQPIHDDKVMEPLPIPENLRRKEDPGLPRVPVDELKAFYSKLGTLNISPDDGCYPLGSCTMKYNPHVNDFTAALPGFADLHPQVPEEDAQGSLELLHRVQEWFTTITGLAAVTTQPIAGAQGELVGLKMFQAWHRHRGDTERDVILIPRSAHGTNFATATMAGFENRKVDGRQTGIVLLESDPDGQVDMDSLRETVRQQGRHISGIMITNPNTGGIYESRFKEIADLIHEVGGLVYMDGANLNAIAGWIDLGAIGVDAVHSNLHKTWTIPHGGGGPGDAIVAVSATLADFLPGRQIVKTKAGYRSTIPAHTIGSFHRHWGNFAHKVRAYTYLARLGRVGVKRMSAVAVLASRYVNLRLKDAFPPLPANPDVPRMHEFIITLPEATFAKAEEAGITRANIIPRVGKLFLDFGYHAPTVAFPEVYGLMIEPTESYTKAELDRFVETVRTIGKLINEHPHVLATAPHFTPIDRVDEVAANRELRVSQPLTGLPPMPPPNRMEPKVLLHEDPGILRQQILEAAAARQEETTAPI